jgi:hypothetical protein
MLSLIKRLPMIKAKTKKSVEMLEHFRRSYDFSKTSKKRNDWKSQLTPVK